MYLSFENPSYLLFFVAIPIFILIHFISLKKSKNKAVKFANFDAIAKVSGVDIFSKNISILFLSCLIAFITVLALAGIAIHKTAEISSFSIILSIDSSRSMEANDILPTRLDAAKTIAKDFVDKLPGGEIGIVSFSGSSYINQKPTENKEIIKNAISNIQISKIEGTDIAETVAGSINLFREGTNKKIILLSDGQINVGSLEEAIKYAKDNDIVIDTIAFGTANGGQTTFGISKMDEDSLKALAFNTNGIFLVATDKAALEESFQKIASLKTGTVKIDLVSELLIALLVLLLLEFWLVNTRYRLFP